MANVRSPQYPSVSLGEAIKRVQVIYKKEHKHPAARVALAKTLGYSGLNGGSTTMISALLKYGLLEPFGKTDQLKVSEDAIDILVHLQGEPERATAIREAAFRPALFHELHELHGDTLPSDHNIRVYLLKRGFNPNSVDSVIRIYRDTIEFVNMETQGSNTESVEKLQEMPPMQTHMAKQMGPISNSVLASAPRSESLVSSPSVNGLNEKVWSLDLTEDCTIRMVLTGHVTKEALDNLEAFIELSKKAVPSASTKPAAVEPETDHHEDIVEDL